MSKHHDLKTWPLPFAEVRAGLKLFEIRANDRDYQPGDTVTLREWEPLTHTYTGEREGPFTLGTVIPGGEWGLPENLCVFSLLAAQAPAVTALPEGVPETAYFGGQSGYEKHFEIERPKATLGHNYVAVEIHPVGTRASLRSPAPVRGEVEEALARSEKHLTDWLNGNDCDCEDGHKCGRTEVDRTRDDVAGLRSRMTGEGISDSIDDPLHKRVTSIGEWLKVLAPNNWLDAVAVLRKASEALKLMNPTPNGRTTGPESSLSPPTPAQAPVAWGKLPHDVQKKVVEFLGATYTVETCMRPSIADELYAAQELAFAEMLKALAPFAAPLYAAPVPEGLTEAEREALDYLSQENWFQADLNKLYDHGHTLAACVNVVLYDRMAKATPEAPKEGGG